MIVLKDGWNEILEVLGKSKYDLLKDFYAKVQSFVCTDKHGSTKSTVVFINKDDVKVNKFDKPISVKSYLTLTKNKRVNGGEDVVDEIVFEHCGQEENIRQLDSALRIREKDGVKVGTLICCKGTKSQGYSFEIKANKVMKFEELKEEKLISTLNK